MGELANSSNAKSHYRISSAGLRREQFERASDGCGISRPVQGSHCAAQDLHGRNKVQNHSSSTEMVFQAWTEWRLAGFQHPPNNPNGKNCFVSGVCRLGETG